MANTYTQIYLQLVFAVKNRECLLRPSYAEYVFQYITGIVQHPTRAHKVLAINGMPDHIHIALGLHTTQSIAFLVRDIKALSSSFINQQQFIRGKFAWQKGYGAFSYGRSQLNRLVSYVNNQQEHHKRHSFQEEYERLLEIFGVEYDRAYVFDWI